MPNLTEILTGFGSVAIIIVVGWLVGRSGVIGSQATRTLNMVVFWVAMPCMLASTLAKSDVSVIFGVPFAVAALSALSVAVIYRLVAAPLLGQSGAGAIVGGMSSSYNNVANLGIPIAIAVLHDAASGFPALIFQIAFYAPLTMAILDFLTSRDQNGGGRVNVRRVVMTPLHNPIFIAAVLGLLVSVTGWQPPAMVTHPIELLGSAAVPMALLAFGMSLYGMPFMQKGVSPRRAVAVSSVMKTMLHPFLAWVFASFLFGMEGHALLSAVVIAGLPTAQNVYTFSSRYGENLEQARDSGVVTTVACVPVIILIALILS